MPPKKTPSKESATVDPQIGQVLEMLQTLSAQMNGLGERIGAVEKKQGETCLYWSGFTLGGKVPDETGGSIPGTLQKTGEDGRINRQWCTHFVGVRSIRFEAMHVQTRRTCNN